MTPRRIPTREGLFTPRVCADPELLARELQDFARSIIAAQEAREAPVVQVVREYLFQNPRVSLENLLSGLSDAVELTFKKRQASYAANFLECKDTADATTAYVAADGSASFQDLAAEGDLTVGGTLSIASLDVGELILGGTSTTGITNASPLSSPDTNLVTAGAVYEYLASLGGGSTPGTYSMQRLSVATGINMLAAGPTSFYTGVATARPRYIEVFTNTLVSVSQEPRWHIAVMDSGLSSALAQWLPPAFHLGGPAVGGTGSQSWVLRPAGLVPLPGVGERLAVVIDTAGTGTTHSVDIHVWGYAV